MENVLTDLKNMYSLTYILRDWEVFTSIFLSVDSSLFSWYV